MENFEKPIVTLLSGVYPSANIEVTKFGNVKISNVPGDSKRTVHYCFYNHPEGIHIRRKVEMDNSWCYNTEYYQLNRNSSTNSWPAFENPGEAVTWFINYCNKNFDNPQHIKGIYNI